MTLASHLFALICAASLIGCGGGMEPYAPAGSEREPAPLEGGKSPSRALGQATAAASAPAAGLLDVSTAAGVMSYLSAVHAVVRDAQNQVVGGADSEASGAPDDTARQLSLVLPAGSDYTLSLAATNDATAPAGCTASIGPLSIEGAATASVQVFAWHCGDVTGYVPSDASDAYPWLADWMFVTRTSAAIGELIGVSAAGHDATGKPAQFTWSAAASAPGAFVEPTAATTSFRCQAAAEQIPLTVTLSDGVHTQQVTQTVACF